METYENQSELINVALQLDLHYKLKSHPTSPIAELSQHVDELCSTLEIPNDLIQYRSSNINPLLKVQPLDLVLMTRVLKEVKAFALLMDDAEVAMEVAACLISLDRLEKEMSNEH